MLPSLGVSSNQPWTAWPSTLQEVQQNEECQKLLNELTSIATGRQLVEETRGKFLREAKNCHLHCDGQKNVVLLQGGRTDQWMYYSADTGKGDEFKQEQYFRYLFGTQEPDLYGVLELDSGNAHLFVPQLSEEAQRFNGCARDAKFYRDRYGISEIHSTQQLSHVLQSLNVHTMYLLYGQNTDSCNYTDTVPNIEKLKLKEVVSQIDYEKLFPIISECRVHKTPAEISYLRFACYVTSMAHVYVMRHIRAGMVELQAEALFKGYCTYAGGARSVSYNCICGSGCNAAILHYGHSGRPNDRRQKDGDMVLYDMGGLFPFGYVTDITCSFPLSGRFSSEQRVIYTAVLAANRAVQAVIKPAVKWIDMHRLAERVILKHLKEADLLKGEVEEMALCGLGAVFMPHGLGHLMGLDVHDVGGFNKGAQRSKDVGPSYLRTTRVLEEGMIITVEPGCYFVDYLLKKSRENPIQSKYLNNEKLDEFRDFGGIRIEDDVLITASGCENLTVVPRTVEEIEEVMKKSTQR